jgi:hypothetical protein
MFTSTPENQPSYVFIMYLCYASFYLLVNLTKFILELRAFMVTRIIHSSFWVYKLWDSFLPSCSHRAESFFGVHFNAFHSSVLEFPKWSLHFLLCI